MISYILIGMATISFTAGLIFLLKGSKADEEVKVEPISDLREIKELKKGDTSDKALETPSNRQTWIVPGQPKQIQPSSSQPGNLKADTSLAYTSTIYDQQNRIVELEQEILAIKGARSEDLKNGEDKIQELSSENIRLKESLEREQEIFQKNREAMAQVNARLQEAAGKLTATQEDRKNIENKNRALQADIENLQRQMEDNQQLVAEQRLQIEALQNEKNLFAEQTTDYEQKLQALSEELNDARKNLDGEKRRIEEELKAKYANTKSDSKVTDGQSSQLEDKIKQLEQECEELRQAKVDLIRNFEKIKEFNEHLLEKEKTLHYELTKSRAQSLGLSKICEDFKGQIETMRNNRVN